eukprot:gene15188-21263_t
MELSFFDHVVGNLDWSVRRAIAHPSIAITVVEFGALLIHSFSLLFIHTTCIPENDEESNHPGGAFQLSFSHPLLALFSLLDKSPIMTQTVSSCQDHLAESFLDVALISSLVVGLISWLVESLEGNIEAAYREFVGQCRLVTLMAAALATALMPPAYVPQTLSVYLLYTTSRYVFYGWTVLGSFIRKSQVDVMGIQLPSFTLELPLILLLAFIATKKLDGSDHGLIIGVNEVSVQTLFLANTVYLGKEEADEAHAASQTDPRLSLEYKCRYKETRIDVVQTLFLANTVDLGKEEADEAYAASQTDTRLFSEYECRYEETRIDVVTFPEDLDLDLGQEADEAYAARKTDLGLLSDHKRQPEETGREVVASRQAPTSAARGTTSHDSSTGATAHDRSGEETSEAAGQETELVPYVSSKRKAPDSEMKHPLQLHMESLSLGAAIKMVVREQKTHLYAMKTEGSRGSDTGAEKSFTGIKVTHVSSDDIEPPPETSGSTTSPSDSDSSSIENALYTGKGGFVSVCARVASEQNCQETALAKASELITEAIQKFGEYRKLHVIVSVCTRVASEQNCQETALAKASELITEAIQKFGEYRKLHVIVSVCTRVASEQNCQETALAKASELVTEAIRKFGRKLKSPPLHIEVLTLSHSGGSSAASGSSGNSNPKSVTSGGIESNLLLDIVIHAIYGPPFLAEVGCDPADMRPEVNAVAAAGLRADIAERMLTETLFQSNHVAEASSLIVTMGPAPIYGPHHHFRLAEMSTVSESDQAEGSGPKPGSSRHKTKPFRSDSRARASAHAGASISTTGASTSSGVGRPTMTGALPLPYDEALSRALQTLDLVEETQQAEGGGMALLTEEPAVVDMRLQTGEAGMLGHLEDAAEAEEAEKEEFIDMPSYGGDKPGSPSKNCGLRDEEHGGVMRCDEEHIGCKMEESDEEDMPCDPAQVWCSGGPIEGPSPDRCYLSPVALPQSSPILGISTKGASSTQNILVLTDFLGMVDTYKGHMQLLVTQSGSVLHRQTLSHGDFQHGVCTVVLPVSGLGLGTLFCHLIFSKTPFDDHSTESYQVESGSQVPKPSPRPTQQPEMAKTGIPVEPDDSAVKEGTADEIFSSGGAAHAAGVPSAEDETQQGVRFVASLPLLCLPDGAAGEMRTLFEKMVRKMHSQLRRLARINAIAGPVGTRSTAEAGAAATGVGFFTPTRSSEGSPVESPRKTAEPDTETSHTTLRYPVPGQSSPESLLFVTPSKGVPQNEQATTEEAMQAVEASTEEVPIARKINTEVVPDVREADVQAAHGRSTTDVQSPLAPTVASVALRLEEATPDEAIVHQMEGSGLDTRAGPRGYVFRVPEYHEESPRSPKSAEEGEDPIDLEEKAEYAERVSAYQEADDAEIDMKDKEERSAKAKAAKPSFELVMRFDVIRCRAYQEHFCPLAADLQCILSLGSLRERTAQISALAPTESSSSSAVKNQTGAV